MSKHCIKASGADSTNDWLRHKPHGAVLTFVTVEAAWAHVQELRTDGLAADDRYDITYTVYPYAKVRDTVEA